MTHLPYFLPTREDVHGPYSVWPREDRSPWLKRTAIAFSVAALAVFAHCGVPMIIA